MDFSGFNFGLDWWGLGGLGGLGLAVRGEFGWNWRGVFRGYR